MHQAKVILKNGMANVLSALERDEFDSTDHIDGIRFVSLTDPDGNPVTVIHGVVQISTRKIIWNGLASDTPFTIMIDKETGEVQYSDSSLDGFTLEVMIRLGNYNRIPSGVGV